MRAEQPVELRPYRCGDEALICRLFAATFGRDLSLAEWSWKYRALDADPCVWVSVAGEEIVGHYAGLPTAVWWQGQKILAYAIVDSMTHPAWRGRARFVELARCFFAEYCGGSQGAPLIYGFPGEHHRLLGERRLGYRPVAPVHVLERSLVSAPDEPQVRSLVEGDAALDAAWDACWRRRRARLSGAVDRSSARLRWRYLQRPGCCYDVLALKDQQTTVGLAVLRVLGRDAWILEFLCEPDRETAAVLLATVLHRAWEKGGRRLRAWLPAETWEAKFLVAAGAFLAAEAEHYFECRTFTPGLCADDLRGGFLYSMGDYDVV